MILFSNYNSNRALVSSHLTTEVYTFVYQNYRPYKLVVNHWFWKKSPGGMPGAQLTDLDIRKKITNLVYANSEAFVFLDGVLELENIYNIDALYIASVSLELPIAVAAHDANMVRVKSGFLEIPLSLKIPMISISPGTKSFQVWGYSSANHERIKIGQKFELDHTKIKMKNNEL